MILHKMLQNSQKTTIQPLQSADSSKAHIGTHKFRTKKRKALI